MVVEYKLTLFVKFFHMALPVTGFPIRILLFSLMELILSTPLYPTILPKEHVCATAEHSHPKISVKMLSKLGGITRQKQNSEFRKLFLAKLSLLSIKSNFFTSPKNSVSPFFLPTLPSLD
jgi:hypothetical protein